MGGILDDNCISSCADVVYDRMRRHTPLIASYSQDAILEMRYGRLASTADLRRGAKVA